MQGQANPDNTARTPVDSTAPVPAVADFGTNYWRQGQWAPLLDAVGPDDLDRAEYKALADNLPTLCWIANADGYITWYNRRWHTYCGTTPEQMEGWGWQSVHDPAVLPAVMAGWTGAIASGEPFEMTFPLRGADGVFRPFLTRIIPVRDEAGTVRRWVGNNVDISRQLAAEQEVRRAQEELRQANAELAEREAFLSSVLAASTDCIKVVELDGTLSFMSEGGLAVMDIGDFNAVKGCPWPDLLKDGGVGQARDAIAAATQGRSSQFETAADTYVGTPKYWSVSVSPIAGPDGGVARILSVSRDITALRDAHEQQRLLAGELGHRLKNVLAIVQSIAAQTLRGAVGVDAAAAAFSSRLASLGDATDLLTASSWQNAELHDVVDAGLAAVAGMTDRIFIDGPRITLNAEAALALTLALHELATNAVKYGALGDGSGIVTMNWSVTDDDEPRFRFVWRESGGPIVVPPARQGFGSRMIARSLRSYFRGDTTLAYLPDGVTFTIDAPLGATGERIAA